MEALFILDPAHGNDVSGKCSPDGRFHEWEWSRQFINRLMAKTESYGLQMVCLVPEAYEIGLSARVKRYNAFQTDAEKIMISIHSNAAGDGTKWMKARGFEVWTTKGETPSDEIATVFCNFLENYFPDLPMRKDMSDDDPDKESNFTVLTGAGYRAILTENLFQDSSADVELLLSSEFNDVLEICYLEAMKYIRDAL